MSPRAWTVVRRQFHKQPDLRIVTEGEYTDQYGGVQPNLGPERIIQVRGPHELPTRTTCDNETPLQLSALPDLKYKQRPAESSQEIWEAFVEKWGTGCWYCGTAKAADRRELQLDHIEPNQRDGSNDDCWNRALACVACNSDKSDKLTPEQTIDLALKSGRISTPALRDEQVGDFERRHQWAYQRWDEVKHLRVAT